jgi:Domain of unknown function (DUF4440)
MRTALVPLALLLGSAPALAATEQGAQSGEDASDEEKLRQDLVALSATKWRWMSERNVAALAELFHTESTFVHMGGTMTKAQELEVIKGGMIQYKTVDIQDVSVRRVGTVYVLHSKIRLIAIVGGSEVTNPFMVTEVYVPDGKAWKLGSLAFTRLAGA